MVNRLLVFLRKNCKKCENNRKINIPIFIHWDNPLFENKINNFQMPLSTLIDARSTTKYLKVYQFCYLSNFKGNASSNKIDWQF